MQGCGAAFDLEAAGHDAFVAATGFDAILHHLPDMQQARAGLGFRAPGGLVGQHHLADRQVVFGAMRQQLFAGGKGVLQYGAVFDNAVGAGGLFIDHEAAADRVILARADLQTGGVEGAKNHAVGVKRQRLADHCQVLLFYKVDSFFAEQLEFAAAANRCQAGVDGIGVDAVRLFAFQAEQHGFVAAMALAGGAEGAV